MSAYSSMYTANATKNWIWVTIYDLGKTTHLDYGWVEPGVMREWQAGNYLYGSFYHVRAEVKAGGPEDTPNIFDTNVEVNPQDTIFPSLLKNVVDMVFLAKGLGKAADAERRHRHPRQGKRRYPQGRRSGPLLVGSRELSGLDAKPRRRPRPIPRLAPRAAAPNIRAAS